MYEINWKRSIQVCGVISDELITKLTPDILNHLSEGNEPITVGIDSPGGSLAANDRLFALLNSPTQFNKPCHVYTVATNQASSAAANLLAYGDYAAALPHASILFHDVRYGGLRDVTPDVAKTTAKQLSDLNDYYAAKLAHSILRRIVWVYLDLQSKFEASKESNAEIAQKFERCAQSLNGGDRVEIDFVGFWSTLYDLLSKDNKSIIADVVEKIEWWLQVQNEFSVIKMLREPRSRVPGTLDGLDYLVRRSVAQSSRRKMSEVADLQEHETRSLDLLVRLAAARIARHRAEGKAGGEWLVDDLISDYELINTMNDPAHIRATMRVMQRHKPMFAGLKGMEAKSDEEQKRLLAEIFPVARLFWIFCVLLCRTLFDGEHRLTPQDAQLIGVIDEVIGGGPIESRREFQIKLAEEKKEKEKALQQGGALAVNTMGDWDSTFGESA